MFSFSASHKTVAGVRFNRQVEVACESDDVVCIIKCHNTKQGLRLPDKRVVLCDKYTQARHAVPLIVSAFYNDDTVREQLFAWLVGLDANDYLVNNI